MTTHATPTEAGWYPDPSKRFETRFFDGSIWTQAVMRGGQVESDHEPFIAPRQGGFVEPGVPGHQVVGPPPSPTDRITSLPPQEAQNRVYQMLAMAGISSLSTEPGRIRGKLDVKGELNMVLFVVLLLFWIIPGLIYWMSKSKAKRVPVDLLFIPNGSGTRIVVKASGPALDRIGPVLAQLPW